MAVLRHEIEAKGPRRRSSPHEAERPHSAALTVVATTIRSRRPSGFSNTIFAKQTAESAPPDIVGRAHQPDLTLGPLQAKAVKYPTVAEESDDEASFVLFGNRPAPSYLDPLRPGLSCQMV